MLTGLLLIELAAGTAIAPAQVTLPARIGSPVSLELEDDAKASDVQRVGSLAVHGALVLGRTEISDDVFIAGMSGLAFSADTNTLFAVSDLGKLWQLQPVFENGHLVAVDALDGRQLRDTQGRPLKLGWSDAEGLAVVGGENGVQGDEQLLVAFEQIPRIGLFDLSGKALRNVNMPARFRNWHNYEDKNRSLEALTVLSGSTPSQFEVLAAPERPMRGARDGSITVFSLRAEQWPYRLGRGANNGVVAMQALADGSIVFLERGFGKFPPRLSLRLRLLPALPARSRPLNPRNLAELSTLKGHRIDNFEGLAHHRGRYFFIISDNNNLFLQRTLLAYISLGSE